MLKTAAEFDEPGLWERWRGQSDPVARDRLVQHYTAYARVVAASYYGKRYNDDAEFGDYFQLACVGLLEAVDRFDPAYGVKFKSFAAKRIEGAILDGLERISERQQQSMARARLAAQRLEAVKAMANARHEAEGASAGTGKPGSRTPEQLLEFVAEVGIGLALTWLLEGTGMLEAGEPSEHQPFYRSVQLRQLRERIHALVRALPTQEQQVIRGHYLQEQPFEQIAAAMQLTRGRISQLHRQALGRLKSSLQAARDLDSGW